MIFTVENQHVADCGTPPDWLKEPRGKGETRSYFENGLGEQWIAFASPQRLRVACGDAGWDQSIDIENPDYKNLAENLNNGTDGTIGGSRSFQNMVVGQDEAAWLIAVLSSKIRAA